MAIKKLIAALMALALMPAVAFGSVTHQCNVTTDEFIRYQQLDDMQANRERAAQEAEWNVVTTSYDYYDYYTPSNDTFTADYGVSDGLNAFTGVNYHDGRRETYYSSNVLYHYRTPEWTLDEEGFYRTSEGYYVVAASDMEQGTTFEGSKGTCIVLDCGCADGTTDYYVAW